MTIKALLITEGNEDTRGDGDFYDVMIIPECSTTNEDMMIKSCDEENGSAGMAIWLYVGDDWHDEETGEDNFHPWDTDNVTLIRVASEVGDEEDKFMEDWRREIAMEAGMMGGSVAYNDAMGY